MVEAVTKAKLELSSDKGVKAALKIKGAHRVRPPAGAADVRGLYFRVQSIGSGAWALRASRHGKLTWFGIGRYPDISLADAREIAQDMRTTIAMGGNPRRKRGSEIVTWAMACKRCFEHERPKWSNEKAASQFINTLEQYTFPSMGHIPAEDIGPEHITAAIRPIWSSKHETATRTLQRCGVVLRWALAHGHYKHADSTGKVMERARAMLGPVTAEAKAKTHQLALPMKDVPSVIAALSASSANPITKLLAEFTILTAARSGEARMATWSEIDWEARVWRLSAPRMKARRLHEVPLSARAMAILEAARGYTDGSNLIFPGAQHGRPVSDATVRKLFNTSPTIRALIDKAHPPVLQPDGTYKPQRLTMHGFRSCFADWATDHGHPAMMVELSLAHEVSDIKVRGYHRSLHLEPRREIMEAWADFTSPPRKATENVVPLRR